jgi:hypothetical protein
LWPSTEGERHDYSNYQQGGQHYEVNNQSAAMQLRKERKDE